jgi:cobalt-zinc-cadmium efflux system membrane fusion protein
MKKYNIVKTIILSIITVALFSCKSGSNTQTETEEEEVLPEDIVELREDQIKLANIETGSIELRSLSGTLKVSGTVTTSPQNLATVCLPMGGFVKNTSLIAGSAVSKGQILATVENQDFVDIQQNYLEVKNKLEFAEAEYKRHTELYKDDVYSQKNVQQVTSDYKTLKAQAKALEQKLSLIGVNPSTLNEDNINSAISVSSPISGYIKAVNINIGKYVAPSDVMFEIVNSNNLLLELTLFEKDADKTAIGQNIRFFINNETEQHNATIYQTGKSIGSDKTIKAFAQVQGSCKNVLPGMYVNATIETSGNSKVTALPSEAIVNFDDKDYIFVFEKNKEEDGKPFTEYRMIQIQKGFTDNGYTEVKLPEGMDYKNMKVVTKGAYNLLSAKKNAGEMAC